MLLKRFLNYIVIIAFIENGDHVRIWKETVAANFEILFWYSLGMLGKRM
jgi:hypothetical protein